MEKWIVIIFLAGFAYLIYRGKKKDKPEPIIEYAFPDRPLRVHFVCTLMKEIKRVHWNFTASEVRHYGYDGARVFGTSFESIWDKTEAETDGGHSWENQVSYYVQRDGIYRLNEWNEEYFDAMKRWAVDFLTHDLAFIYSIFSGAPSCWARRDRNDHGLDGGGNRKFYSLHFEWYQSGRIKQIIDKVMENLNGMPNIILEIANEPFPFDTAFHTELLHYIESKRQKMGWDSLRYQVNPEWAQAVELGRVFKDRLYVSTHTHNTEVNFWDAISSINPHTEIPGGAVRSWDNGSYRYVKPQTIVDHLDASERTGNSIETFFMDWHEQSHETVRQYVERVGR